MKYEYGKEYKTNGEKPYLPDDVVIKYKNKAGCREWEGKVGELAFTTDSHPNPVTSFRIIDERYKQKEQDMSNDWYNRGELPPVGEVVELYHCGSPQGKAELVNTRDDQCVWWNHSKDRRYQYGYINEYVAKPIRTETDKLLEQAKRDIGAFFEESDTHAIKELIAKGWRPTEGEK